jgi:hypothetical protein
MMDLSRDRRMRPSLGMAVALVLGLIVPGPAPSAAQESLTVEPAGVVTWDEIVRRDAVQTPAESAPHAVPFLPAPPGREIGAVPGPRSPVAPSLVTPPPTLPQPNGPAIATNFAALGDDDTVIPPDTMGVAGPSHLMTMLNSEVRIQDKGGGIISTVSLMSFWTAGTGLAGSPFDPHLVYDALSGRWLATVFADGDSSTSKVFFAISATSNPTGTWSFYGFTADTGATTWADYPGFGVNNTWVAITANMFTIASLPTFVAAKMWVIDKATALAGGTLTVTVFPPGFDSAGGAFGFALKPAVTFSAGEPTLHIVDNSGFAAGGTQLVRLSRITGTGPAPAWSVVPGSSFAGSGLFFVTNNFDGTQIGAAQAGTTTTVDTNDPRSSDSVFRNGRLWFAHSGGLPVGAVDRTAVFWYQVDPTAMPTPIVQSGVLDGGAGVHHFFPSITANSANDALIGFSRSDATKFVEAVAAGRFGTDAPGTMMGPSVVKAGEGCYVKTFGAMENRSGDYSATSIDPTDDLTFWTVQEYAATPSPAISCADGSGRWGTWWGTTTAVSTTTTTTSTTQPPTTTTTSSSSTTSTSTSTTTSAPTTTTHTTASTTVPTTTSTITTQPTTSTTTSSTSATSTSTTTTHTTTTTTTAPPTTTQPTTTTSSSSTTTTRPPTTTTTTTTTTTPLPPTTTSTTSTTTTTLLTVLPPTACPDAQAAAAIEAAVEAHCNCFGATNHGAFVRCATRVAKDAVKAGTLPKQCKGAVKHCAARSTCGKPGFVTCCRTTAKGTTTCSTKSSAAVCKPSRKGTACVGQRPSCCDACASGGCAELSGARPEAP